MAIKSSRTVIRYVVLVALLAATLSCAKLALSFLPNVEIVTLLCALYGYVFGVAGIVAAVVFVTLEPLLYGFGTWIISYYLYWPLVAFVFFCLGRVKLKSRVILSAVALLLTAFFGVLSSFVDVGLFSGSYDHLFYRFGIYYLRGLPFYAIQLACNAVIFPLLFRPMANALERMKRRTL